MAKVKDQPPEVAAACFGVGKLTRHLFLCTGPDCTDPEEGERTWKYVKTRMKELNIAGSDGPCYRTRCQCLRICSSGPIAVVYPEGTWYHSADPAVIERILQEHILQGHPVQEYIFVENPL